MYDILLRVYNCSNIQFSSAEVLTLKLDLCDKNNLQIN